MQKLDKTLYGVLVGMVLPIIGFFLSFLIKARGTTIDFDTYVNMAINGSADQQDILIFCMIPGMFLFYFNA